MSDLLAYLVLAFGILMRGFVNGWLWGAGAARKVLKLPPDDYKRFWGL